MLNLCAHSCLRECPEKGRRKKKKPSPEANRRKPITKSNYPLWTSHLFLRTEATVPTQIRDL